MLQYEVDNDGVAIIRLDQTNKATNVINEATMVALGETLERAITDNQVKGIIITSAKKDFLVGADLDMLLPLTQASEIMEMTGKLNGLFRRLETCGKPVVAAINGTALGGGLELCLACHHRIALDKPDIQLGLPEIMLGLLPGAGGTQRLPRLIGIQNALSLILEGKKLRPSQALAQGIIHKLAQTPEELLSSAKEYILQGGTSTQPWDQPKFKVPGGDILTPNGVMVMTAASALMRKKTYGNYPAAQHILSCVYEGLQLPIDRALVVESRYFTACCLSKESKHMIQTLFFALSNANKGAARPVNVPETNIQKVGVFGAGMMGAGIAYVSAIAGLQVVLKDVSKENAEKGKAYSARILGEKLQKKHISSAEHDSILNRIFATENSNDLAGCDLIIEAVFEDRGLKARVTQEAESVNKPTLVFASNTSTLPISGLAESSTRPENFIGLHFFSPVEKMPLVEIIMGEKTSDYALALSIDYIKKIKKTPIVVNDGRGFFTSRVFATYVKEGIEMLAEGIPPAVIENIGKACGMPVGPLALADEVSLDLLHHIVKQTEKDLGIKIEDAAAKVGELFVEVLKRPGKKSGKGFYEYPENGKKHLWKGLAEHYPQKSEYPDAEILKKRFLHVQALDAARCLAENVLTNTTDGDVGSIMGWGFAPFTGGVMSYINFVGAEKFIQECNQLALQYGKRFEVPEIVHQKFTAN
ncbi:MAG: enoyl-CoA hydratase/isomerase family protein [Bacteroidia bacterium]|nr:enoyl-CoA hydratase/isomerase family protein [Bacteroidia bacterium]